MAGGSIVPCWHGCFSVCMLKHLVVCLKELVWNGFISLVFLNIAFLKLVPLPLCWTFPVYLISGLGFNESIFKPGISENITKERDSNHKLTSFRNVSTCLKAMVNLFNHWDNCFTPRQKNYPRYSHVMGLTFTSSLILTTPVCTWAVKGAQELLYCQTLIIAGLSLARERMHAALLWMPLCRGKMSDAFPAFVLYQWCRMPK